MKPSEVIKKFLMTEYLPLLVDHMDQLGEIIVKGFETYGQVQDRFILHQFELQNKLLRQIRDLIEESK